MLYFDVVYYIAKLQHNIVSTNKNDIKLPYYVLLTIL